MHREVCGHHFVPSFTQIHVHLSAQAIVLMVSKCVKYGSHYICVPEFFWLSFIVLNMLWTNNTKQKNKKLNPIFTKGQWYFSACLTCQELTQISLLWMWVECRQGLPRVLATWGLITGPAQGGWPAHCLVGFLPRRKSLLVPSGPSDGGDGGLSFGTKGLRKGVWKVGGQETMPQLPFWVFLSVVNLYGRTAYRAYLKMSPLIKTCYNSGSFQYPCGRFSQELNS